jgi:hypothetical protein
MVRVYLRFVLLWGFVCEYLYHSGSCLYGFAVILPSFFLFSGGFYLGGWILRANISPFLYSICGLWFGIPVIFFLLE